MKKLIILILLFIPSHLSAEQFTPAFTGQNDYPPGSGRYAEYEREIQAVTPTPGHGWDCDTTKSGQHPSASDEYIVTKNGSGTTEFEAIHNSSSHSWKKIFICPGDYSRSGLYDGSDGNEIYIKQGGSDSGSDHEHDSSWVSFVWWDDDEADDGKNPYRWNDPGSPGSGPERAVLPRLEFYDVKAILFQGTTHVGRTSETDAMKLNAGSGTKADDIILNRIYVAPTYKSSSEVGDGIDNGNGCDYVTVQNSVVTDCGYQADYDSVGVKINGAEYMRIVNNEIFDCTDNITGSCTTCTAEATIIENNELYFTAASYTTLDGAPGVDESPTTPPAGSGDYMCRENAIDIKGGTPSDTTAGTRTYIIGNRIWGGKPGFVGGTSCTCGSSGDMHNRAIQFFENVKNIYVGNNIIFDYESSGIFISTTNSGGSNLSFNGNVIHTMPRNDARDSGSGGTCGSTQSPTRVAGFDRINALTSNEFRFNTVVGVTGGSEGGTDHHLYYSAGATNIDSECNLFIDNEAYSGTDPTTGWINDNAFIGTTKKYKSSEADDNYSATLATWAGTTSYSANNWVRPTSPVACTTGGQTGCFLYVAEGGGTSGSGQPPWPTQLGGSVDDNGITWRAALGPGCFKIKGWTGVETKCLGYMVPWSGKTDWQECEGQVVGDRTSYGVDDTTYDFQ